jgi:hypothetical protein
VRATFQSIDVWLAILLGLDFVHHSLTGFKEYAFLAAIICRYRSLGKQMIVTRE